MTPEIDYQERREKAKKRVEELKNFYAHLRVYIVVNVLLILIKTDFFEFIIDKTGNADPNFLYWLDYNIVLTPVLWGIGLLIHAIVVYRYKFTFFKNWEERQIQKFLEEEDQKNNPYK